MTLRWSSSYGPVDEDFANVSLLLKGEGTNNSTTILDSSSNNLSVSVVNDAKISTTVATPFSTTVPSDGVLAFDGAGDYLEIPNSSDFEFGTGDFTVEIWFRPAALSGQQVLIDTRSTNSPSVTDKWIVFANGTSLGVVVAGSTFTNGTLLLNAWNFIALSRQTGTTRIFLNGVQLGGNITDATNYGIGNQRPIVGADGNNSTLLNVNGYISNLRITKDVARYTENFDVPTAPFPILSPSGRITIADDNLDADARQYIINVEEQDREPLEPAVRTAINDFVVGCKNDGIWNAIKASCLLCGARTLEGALVPLKGGAPTNFNFTSDNYDRELGLVGDATSKYLDTNFKPSDVDQDDAHFSTYVTSVASSALTAYLGVVTISPNNFSQIIDNNGPLLFSLNSTGSQSFSGLGNTVTGFLGTSRTTSNSQTSRFNGTSSTSFALTSVAPLNLNYFVFGRNYNGPNILSDRRHAFYSFGDALDLALLDTRISDFITAIGVAI